MYFWRIDKLKAEMAVRPLSEREVLPYLVVQIALLSVAGYIPATTTNVWDGLGAVWSVSLAIVGTIYIYRQNGGAAGRHFLQRYFAIGWVVLIRWLPMVVLMSVAFFALKTLLGEDVEETTWDEFLFIAVVEAVIYLRIGHHVRDLAKRTKEVVPQLDPD
jgi:hypothetical protein